MILIVIGILVVLLFAIIGAVKTHRQNKDAWYRESVGEAFASWFFGAAMIVGIVYVGSQFLLGAANIKSENVTYSQQLVSLNDGTGVEGRFSGGLFVSRGYINDTQHFSYYRVVAPGQYALDKRNAQQSTIWTDATPETARVDVTDKIYTCETTWYSTWCLKNPNEFVHADFHVPNDAIQTEFELDAQ